MSTLTAHTTLCHSVTLGKGLEWNSCSKPGTRVAVAWGPAAAPSLTFWALPNPRLQRGPHLWQSVEGAHTVYRGLSLCQTPPLQCRA